MQRHLDCEKHQRALERHTLLDSEQRQVELFTFRLVEQNLFERSNWVNLHGANRLRNNLRKTIICYALHASSII